MKRIKIVVLLMAFAVVVSCSKSESTPTVNGIDPSTIAPISGQFQKNVLIEDYTGAWCGWCPRVAYAIGLVESQGLRAVPVAIHNGDPMAWGTSSTWPEPVSSFPTAKLNRILDWNTPENSNIIQVKYLTGNNCGLGLAINSTITGSTVSIDVSAKFAIDYSNLKMVVYIAEDNISSTQTNYTSFFGGGSSIPNFDNDHVLRACLTNIHGEAITQTTTSGSTITRNFSIPVPSNVTNVANMNLVAFITDANGTVINVRSSVAGQTQVFEQNQ